MKKDIIKIAAAAALLMTGLLTDGIISLVIFILAYLAAGGETLVTAGRNIIHGQVFDENFLMTAASLGAMALGEYEEAIGVMLFYQVGEMFEDYAVDRSRKSIAGLMDICPDTARILRDGEEAVVDPYDVKMGDLILIRPGEKIPLDGIVREGASSVDASALTGESIPKDVSEGDKIISGCINMTGMLKAEVTSEFEESTVNRILELVENAASAKAPVENFITRFARVYTPIVVFSALALALIPILFLHLDAGTWIYRACLFLIVSCPCALVISVPMSFFSGIGAASSKGVLIKGGNYLQVLADLDTIMLDKTGTLTKGEFVISEICSEREDFLKLAASLEKNSNHPIAACITGAYRGALYDVETFEEIAGKGLCGRISGKRYYAGNEKLMKELGMEVEADVTSVFISCEDEYLGQIKVKDVLKAEAKEAVSQLKDMAGRVVMLTGDNEKAASLAAEEAGIAEYYAELLPADKVSLAEKIIKESGGRCAFAGDGINDAPVIARADLGIAMGGLGSAAAMEAADVVIMDDDISKISLGIRIGKKTLRICRENIVFAIGIKVIVLILGALGLATMWAAVFADVGVAILAILNAMRALRINQ